MIISANTDELESNSARASRLCGSIRADAQALDSALKALQASWKGQAATQAAACEHEWAQAQNQVNTCLEHISLALGNAATTDSSTEAQVRTQFMMR